MAKIDFINLDFDTLIAEAKAKKESIPALSQWDFDNSNDVLRFVLEYYVQSLEKLGAWSNALAQEWTIGTALSRESVIEHALQNGYVPTYRVSASVDVTISHSDPASNTSIPKGALVISAEGSDGEKVYFENSENFTISSGSTQTAGIEFVEGQTKTQTFSSSGTSFQSLIINAPVAEGSITVEVDGQEWTEVDTHLLVGANAERFRLRRLNQTTTQILFGDNSNGKIPSEGSEIKVSYREGGGSRGNVEASTITRIEVNPQGDIIDSVSNPNKSSGGTDPESTDKIRYSAIRLPRLNNRIASLRDLEDFGESYDGVSRVKAYSNFNSPLVYVIPDGGGTPSSSLLEDLQKSINNIIILGHYANTAEPNYVSVELELNVIFNPSHLEATVQTAVDTKITELLNPLHQAEDGIWSRGFGEPLRLSELVNRVLSVSGVLAVETLSPAPTAQSDVLVSCSDDQIITNVGSTIQLNMIESKDYNYVSDKSIKTLFRNPKYDI